MIFEAEYNIELKDGRIGKRTGPLLIPDSELQNLIIEPIFTTSSRLYSTTQCAITGPICGTKIINYNIIKLQEEIEILNNKKEVKGFGK